MAQTVNVIVAAEDRERLLAIAGDRNRPLKHVQPARIKHDTPPYPSMPSPTFGLSSGGAPDTRRALREPVTVSYRTSLSHG